MDLKIVDELKHVLEINTAVHAMWIAGSVAEGYADELSDVDIWLDIDDGKDKEMYATIESFLASYGKLDINFGEDTSPPYSHRVYHLAHTNPYHFIEITLHSHSHSYEFVEGIRKVRVLFDKDSVTTSVAFDKAIYDKMLKERKEFLIKKIKIGELSVQKEIVRKQFMDAMHNYQFWLVEPIIELVRIKYSPLKVSYGLKHGNRDLPKGTTDEIQSLYIIKSLDNLRHKISEVKAMVKKYV